jgi:hypothetical protein
MRTKNKRFNNCETLFVLGAGASYSITKRNSEGLNFFKEEAPLDRNFTARIERPIISVRKHLWVNDAKSEISNDFLHHQKFSDIGLERSISLQLANLEFLDSIDKNKKKKVKLKSNEFIEKITHLITFELDRVKIRDKKIVEKFINKFFDYATVEECPNRIISFNYDTLIDKYLIDKFKLSNKIYFDSIAQNRQSTKKTEKFSYPLMLKLHGSINWKCKTEEYLKIFKNGNQTTEINNSIIIENQSKPKRINTKTYNTDGCVYIDKIWLDKKVDAPGNDTSPLIIPPIENKPITNVAIFRYLWSYAFEYLHDCRELVIIGYSLPDSDTLANSLFTQFYNERLKKITIVDPSTETVLKWIKLFERMKNKKIVIEYYTDFCSYINRLK